MKILFWLEVIATAVYLSEWRFQIRKQKRLAMKRITKSCNLL